MITRQDLEREMAAVKASVTSLRETAGQYESWVQRIMLCMAKSLEEKYHYMALIK